MGCTDYFSMLLSLGEWHRTLRMKVNIDYGLFCAVKQQTITWTM